MVKDRGRARPKSEKTLPELINQAYDLFVEGWDIGEISVYFVEQGWCATSKDVNVILKRVKARFAREGRSSQFQRDVQRGIALARLNDLYYKVHGNAKYSRVALATLRTINELLGLNGYHPKGKPADEEIGDDDVIKAALGEGE